MNTATAGRAAALGAVSGMRSMAGVTALSRRAEKDGPRTRSERLLHHRVMRRVMPIAAAGEMVADKLPFMKARTRPLPLAGRALFGAIAGGIIATEEEGSTLLGAVIGAVTAVAVAHLAYRARKYAHERFDLPDKLIAGVEDALVVGIGALAVRG